MRVFSTLGNDVDDTSDCVCSPDRGSRSANHFDALHIFEQYAVLQRPINASEKRSIEAAAIHKYQHGLGKLVGKSADTYRPMIVINTADLNSWDQAQHFRNAGRSRTPDVLLGKDVNCRGGFPNLFRLFRRGSHFDIAEFCQA